MCSISSGSPVHCRSCHRAVIWLKHQLVTSGSIKVASFPANSRVETEEYTSPPPKKKRSKEKKERKKKTEQSIYIYIHKQEDRTLQMPSHFNGPKTQLLKLPSLGQSFTVFRGLRGLGLRLSLCHALHAFKAAIWFATCGAV